MNDTPQGERTRIVLAGRCNAGKSSLINVLAGQPVAIVSGLSGTTTDPVRKAMEILPIGPVLLCDTPGLDDGSELGSLRMERTEAELRQADIALLVIDAVKGVTPFETEMASRLKELGVPALAVMNKIDLVCDLQLCREATGVLGMRVVMQSSKEGSSSEELKRAIIETLPKDGDEPRLAADFAGPGDCVVLVVPIDSAAPKGRLILPQQQVIRDLLEAGAIPVVARETELGEALGSLKKPPALVITDSQAFALVSKIVPETVPLTSFSILFARYKGDLAKLVEGARALVELKDGDRVLIAEGCTHHRQKDDIGTVKIPALLRAKLGKNLQIEHSSGMGYPKDLKDYSLVVHCGGCMLSRREMLHRISEATGANVPIVNYGLLLATLNGIAERALAPVAK